MINDIEQRNVICKICSDDDDIVGAFQVVNPIYPVWEAFCSSSVACFTPISRSATQLNRAAKVHCIRSCAYPSTVAKIAAATVPALLDCSASPQCLPDTEDRAFHR